MVVNWLAAASFKRPLLSVCVCVCVCLYVCFVRNFDAKYLEDCDVTTMTSQSYVTLSMTPLIDAPYALSYRVPIGHEPLSQTVSEIFSIKVSDRRTHRQTDTQARRLTIRVA